MKIEHKKRVGFFELDADFQLRMKALLDYLQETAAIHSDQAGYDARTLMAAGKAWVLHRIGIQIHRPPTLGDDVRVVTWHKGTQGFRAYRDFEIVVDGETIVSVTSLWLFIDLGRKKILKVPSDVSDRYTIEKTDATDMDIDTWKPDQTVEPDRRCEVAIRPSDYDPLGHVNNALYFDYLETATEQIFQRPRKVRKILIQFIKEIPTGIDAVTVGIKQNGDRFQFSLFSPGAVHAAGECQFLS